jgi:hypothetical protein
MRPTDEQLRAVAQQMYGRPCSTRFCNADRGERAIVLVADLCAERDAPLEGTWITARVLIPDEAVEGHGD